MKDQVPEEIKKDRLHRLEELVASIRRDILEERITSAPTCAVLFETYKDGYATGHTPDFLEVSVKSDRPLHAEIYSVRLTHTDGSLCFGEIEQK
jgi:tRNA A37 methylthiotransferase MiaB